MDMPDLLNQEFLEDELKKYVDEICKYINLKNNNDNKINIHINEKFGFGYDYVDYARQAFIFYTLCKSYFYDNNLISKQTLVGVYLYIYKNYNKSEKIFDGKTRNFIELYTIRGCLFAGLDYSCFLSGFLKNSSRVYTEPLLLHLFLCTESDAVFYKKINLMPTELIDIAKESAIYLIGSNLKNNYAAFNFVDIFYYAETLKIDIKDETFKLVENKVKNEKRNIDKTYTSVLAKLFEGYCNFGTSEFAVISEFWDLIMSRKIKKNYYLYKKFNYSINSLEEVKGSSFVCLDTYAHISLGLITLLRKI